MRYRGSEEWRRGSWLQSQGLGRVPCETSNAQEISLPSCPTNCPTQSPSSSSPTAASPTNAANDTSHSFYQSHSLVLLPRSLVKPNLLPLPRKNQPHPHSHPLPQTIFRTCVKSLLAVIITRREPKASFPMTTAKTTTTTPGTTQLEATTGVRPQVRIVQR